ncbi:unnamed protein product [Rangifer tarandus platyrhynchus]|uniref:Uncharacterized protein n=1 Tax=Rangifer tarandus platyrhynchus TaxID=3082113 RepID=A0ABN9A6A5_RANTA|nr:unnamed protein product [Rangifer tarandus platyrhynchus]
MVSIIWVGEQVVQRVGRERSVQKASNPFFTAQLIFQRLLRLFPPPLQCDNLLAGGEAERRQLDKFIAVEFLDQMV